MIEMALEYTGIKKVKINQRFTHVEILIFHAYQLNYCCGQTW